MPELLETIHDVRVPGINGRRMLAVLDQTKLRRVLTRMLDENEFLGPHGLRALSRYHLEHPFRMDVHGVTYEVHYMPAESDSGLFGGNSNWRGPVWFPVNFLILRGLVHLYAYYGDDFKIECPTGSGHEMTLFEVAEEISRRLVSTFLPDENGRRPMWGGAEKFQTDPSWNNAPPLPRVLPRRQRRRRRREPPDRMDRPRGSDDPDHAVRAAGGPAGRQAPRQPPLPAAENLRSAVDRG